MTSHRDFYTRQEILDACNMERAFVDRWLAQGEGDIPQMPHLPNLGKGTRFHRPSVEAWLLQYFQVGGVFTAAKKERAA